MEENHDRDKMVTTIALLAALVFMVIITILLGIYAAIAFIYTQIKQRCCQEVESV